MLLRLLGMLCTLCCDCCACCACYAAWLACACRRNECASAASDADKLCCTALLKTLQACHNAVKKAWARTTRTFGRTQRARRPSYRLRQSTGAPGSSVKGLALGAAEAGAEEVEEEEVCCVPPALVAAQHAMHT